MTSRARRKSYLGDEDETGRGPWTELEKRRFLEGLAKYGKDFRLLTAEVGTREIGQVRRYYSYHKSKMDPAKEQTPSPSSRKRKDVHEEGNNATITLNRKRTKKTATAGSDKFPNVPLAKMPAGPAKAPAPAVSTSHAVRPTATTRKRSPSKAAAKLNPVEDILPPTKVMYNPPKPKPTPRNHAKQQKAESKNIVKSPSSSSSSSTRIMEKTTPSSTSMKKERLLELLRREEVQSVLSGLLGFAAVIVFKKLVG